MITRLSKIFLVFAVGVFSSLVAYDNVVDYSSNFKYVQHILLMDTIFPGNPLVSRAITNANFHHYAYWLIIATEFLIGALCLIGSLKLLLSIRKPPHEFISAKTTAIIGLTLGLSLWFFGFITIGAEWFQMWQSEEWNGTTAAFRTVTCIGFILIFLNQNERNDFPNCK